MGIPVAEAVREPVELEFFYGPEMSVRSINGGWGHVIVVTESGRVYSQGLNDYGQLALGDVETRRIPTLVQFFESLKEQNYLEQVQDVKCGSYHSLFLTRTGNLYGCGYNEMGSLASGVDSCISIPVLIMQFPNLLVGGPQYQVEVRSWCYTTCILVKKRVKRVQRFFRCLKSFAIEEYKFSDLEISIN